MSTSQRSEGMNALSKIFLDSHTSAYKFVIQFEKIVSSRYKKEDEEEFKMKDGEATLWTLDPIEERAREVYTKKVFADFRDQLKVLTGYRFVEVEKNTFKVFSIEKPSISKQRIYSYIVIVDKDEDIVSCNCKMFEFAGILCAHALKVMHFIGIHYISKKYILKRWTKEAKSGTVLDSVGIVAVGESSNNQAQWLQAVSLQCQKFIYETTKNYKAYTMGTEKLKSIIEELSTINQEPESQKGSKSDLNPSHQQIFISQTSHVNANSEKQIVKDPPQSQCKGKGKPQRLKPPAEKNAKKSRTCANCQKKGHNIKTCKELPKNVANFVLDSSDSYKESKGTS
ncbi:protein FAR1-RELATED SEQUENCE 1-like [Ananas comosus]|uniref:Protein FAR1-RELATED SEQUENCE n=1 Tax=Ananas comosus TaxID=4615 RepID=A0A6P5EZ92_ANACO|nr:protein FAR1-RELATED SEQUENCE 1-like [Ananas comosus]